MKKKHWDDVDFLYKLNLYCHLTLLFLADRVALQSTQLPATPPSGSLSIKKSSSANGINLFGNSIYGQKQDTKPLLSSFAQGSIY